MMIRIGDLKPGQMFRMDQHTQRGTFAGSSYILLEDGRVTRLGGWGNWTLEDCGLTPETVITGPVWGLGSLGDDEED